LALPSRLVAQFSITHFAPIFNKIDSSYILNAPQLNIPNNFNNNDVFKHFYNFLARYSQYSFYQLQANDG